MLIIDILSLFPDYFRGPFDVSILKRAQEMNLLKICHTDIRDFSKDKHKKVDDRPYGGGPGMILTPQPAMDAIRSVKRIHSRVIYLSPQGKPFSSRHAERLSKEQHLILFCGHYEGIDERIIEMEVDEEISIGDYVLTNGCIAAIAVVDAVSRYVPNVLGHPEASRKDSFEQGIFDGPHYTRPEVFEDLSVPEILLGGHHTEIGKWRYEQGLKKTRQVRSDLYSQHIAEKMSSSGQKDKESKSVSV